LGLIWVVGRLIYIRGYQEAAEKAPYRLFSCRWARGVVLWLGALIAIALRMMHGG